MSFDRWTPSRKEFALHLIEDGALSIEALCKTYNISAEEIDSWRRAFAEGGRAALKVSGYLSYAERFVRPPIKAVGMR